LSFSGAEGEGFPVPEFEEWALIIAILGAFVGITIVRKQ